MMQNQAQTTVTASTSYLNNANKIIQYYLSKEAINFGFWAYLFRISLTEKHFKPQDFFNFLQKNKGQLQKYSYDFFTKKTSEPQQKTLFEFLKDLKLLKLGIDIAAIEKTIMNFNDGPMSTDRIRVFAAHALFADMDRLDLKPIPETCSNTAKLPFINYPFQTIKTKNVNFLVGPGPTRDTVANFFLDIFHGEPKASRIVAIGEAGVDFEKYFSNTEQIQVMGGESGQVAVESRLLKTSEHIDCYELKVNPLDKKNKERIFKLSHIKTEDMKHIQLSDDEWQELFQENQAVVMKDEITVVHCKAGLGRSANYVWQMLLMQSGIFNDVFASASFRQTWAKLTKYLEDLREQRPQFFLLPEQFFGPVLVAFDFHQRRAALLTESKISETISSTIFSPENKVPEIAKVVAVENTAIIPKP